jgi:hypothetical protein
MPDDFTDAEFNSDDGRHETPDTSPCWTWGSLSFLEGLTYPEPMLTDEVTDEGIPGYSALDLAVTDTDFTLEELFAPEPFALIIDTLTDDVIDTVTEVVLRPM